MRAGAGDSNHMASPRDYSRLATTAYTRQSMARTALVVGAGALGNEVIKNLALLGIRTLWIADRDRVERSNLTRSILYCTATVDDEIARGTPKAVFAARRAREVNPEVDVTPYVGEIADLGAGVLRRADVVFSCLDNEMARLELSWWCTRLDRPLVDGGLGLINYSSGMVSIFPGRDGPCYACRKGAERRRQLLQDLYGREDPCWAKADALRERGIVATTPLMASVVAAFQIELGLRGAPASNDASRGRAFEITMHPAPRIQSLTFDRSPTCPLHEPSSVVRNVVERRDRRSSEWTVGEMIAESGDPAGSLVLDWPLTAKARCERCGHEWEPLVRRARFRGSPCPGCGATDLVELEVLTSVDRASPWASRTLAGLGLPAGHIHEIARGSPEAQPCHVEVTGDFDAPAAAT
jgi:hypothetical protein